MTAKTSYPSNFEDMVAPMRAAHEKILAKLRESGYAIQPYPVFEAPGNPEGAAAAKAHPMQGILKYHGLADWQWRTAFLPSVSVTNSAGYSLTHVQFSPALSADEAVISGKPATPRELERVSQTLNAVRQIAQIKSPARVTSANVVQGGKAGKGLGTSASGSAALATAALAAAFGPAITQNMRFVSAFARLLAGSGCRSAAGGVSAWLSYPGIAHEDSYAVRLDAQEQLKDVALITVPIDSRLGLKTEQAHVDAPLSPWFKNWMAERGELVLGAVDAARTGDWLTLAQMAETDSIKLHAVTMTGGVENKIFAWEPENITIFRACNDLRAEGVPVYFSTDTGPTLVLMTHRQFAPRVIARMRELGFDTIDGHIAPGAQIVNADETLKELSR